MKNKYDLTANEGPVIIQYKCLVLIPRNETVISKTEL